MSPKENSHRLGRGLAALLGEGSPPGESDQQNPVRFIPIESLEPSPFQPRAGMEPEALAELTESVRTRGVLQPLLGRPHPSINGRYHIIAGERRWRAAQAAGLAEVPVLIRVMDDAEALASALVENLQREDLNALEEAEGFRRLLHEFSMTQERLAAAVGKSRSHIANTLRLLQLPQSIQDQLKKGALSAGHARALLLHPDPERAAETVLARVLNVRQTELLAAESRPSRTEGSQAARPNNPETAALEEELSMRLGLRVEIKGAGQSGSLRIHYKTLDQLDSVLSLLGHAMA